MTPEDTPEAAGKPLEIRVLSDPDIKRLGGLIDAANPYIAVEPMHSFDHTRHPAPFIRFKVVNGIYVEEGVSTPGHNATYKILFDRGCEIQDTGVDWKFKGATHYVKRVLRIPYMYYQVMNKQPGNVGTAALVMDYWLVGFEGSGGY